MRILLHQYKDNKLFYLPNATVDAKYQTVVREDTDEGELHVDSWYLPTDAFCRIYLVESIDDLSAEVLRDMIDHLQSRFFDDV